MKLLMEPDVDIACLELRASLTNSEAIIMVGGCEVEYSGRASSTLTRGEK
ncbi:MAG: hypothetical protein QW701_03895 [Candidatus Nezhaarchaeales archaeon]